MPKGNKIKALVVEDNEKWRKAIVLAVKNLDCEVIKNEDAQSAIDRLFADREKKTINVLFLDWDLRGGIAVQKNFSNLHRRDACATGGTGILPVGKTFLDSYTDDPESALPTALVEDVLEEVPEGNRNDLTVVIITGALDDSDYIGWKKTEGINPLDELFKILKDWQPFLVIRKKDIESGLETGLPSLTSILKEKKLLEEVRRRSGLSSDKGFPQPFEAVEPYQFNWSANPGLLIAGNGAQLTLPAKFAYVIRAMLEKDSSTKSYKLFLTEVSYEAVAAAYLGGLIQEYKSKKKNEKDLKDKIEHRKHQFEENSKVLAQEFAKKFRHPSLIHKSS